MGKNAEFALIAALVKWAGNKGCTHINGFYLPTNKNLPCKDFLEQCGLKKIAGPADEAGQAYEAKLADLQIPCTDHLKISINL